MSKDLNMPDTPPDTLADSADNPWLALRRLTSARIALGRTGTSLTTRAQLDFQYAHAQARDAVHLPFDANALSDELRTKGRETLLLHSAATDRDSYLQRPDKGRRLDEASVQTLRDQAAAQPGSVDIAVVVADGLSSLAVHRHAVPFLARMEELASAEGWTLSPVMLVEQGREDVGDRDRRTPGPQFARQPGGVFHLRPQSRPQRRSPQLHLQCAARRLELCAGRSPPALSDA
jgi:ethanolamine ammonia-lyase small subunit